LSILAAPRRLRPPDNPVRLLAISFLDSLHGPPIALRHGANCCGRKSKRRRWKTCLAVNVAVAFSRTAPAVLVDADPQASASSWIESSPALTVLQAPSPDALRRVLAAAKSRDRAGVVICDCRRLTRFNGRRRRARGPCINPVVRRQYPCTGRAVNSRARRSSRPGRFEFGQARDNAPGIARATLESFGVHVARTEIGYRVAHAAAEAARQAVIDFDPNSPAAAEILALTREIRRALAKG